MGFRWFHEFAPVTFLLIFGVSESVEIGLSLVGFQRGVDGVEWNLIF
jgi:hypothetical protein